MSGTYLSLFVLRKHQGLSLDAAGKVETHPSNYGLMHSRTTTNNGDFKLAQLLRRQMLCVGNSRLLLSFSKARQW